MPLLVAFLLLQHDGEGSPILFDTTRRGIPLFVAFLPFQHDGEGAGPPCCVQVSFLTRQGRGRIPPPRRVLSISTQ